MSQKKAVAILGATGMVGQRAIAMLAEDPDFEVVELAASGNSVGRTYSDACEWRTEAALPQSIASKSIIPITEVTAPYVISALPSDIALEVEPLLAIRGQYVFSNASTFRMQADVPLLIPEINLEHLRLAKNQTSAGKIITNPNCATVFICAALKPLLSLGKIESVHITTLQAVSGAGYPGVSSYDMVGNIVPYISSEEEKVVEETKRILGTPEQAATFPVTTFCTRVPVLHGHTAAIQVRFQEDISASQVIETFQALAGAQPEFYSYVNRETGPQPARDLTWNDQKAYIGRIKQGDDSKTIGLLSMGHNLVRGAAGAAIANMRAYIQELGS